MTQPSSTARARRTGALAPAFALMASVAVAQTAAPQSPSIGDVVPAFETLAIDGKPVKVDFPKGSKTMLLFFLSGCPHCHRMIPEWNRAFDRRPKGLKIVGVIMDPDQAPASFWQEHPISFPVVKSPGREFLRTLNVNRAPLTLRVGRGRQGRGLRARRGLLRRVPRRKLHRRHPPRSAVRARREVARAPSSARHGRSQTTKPRSASSGASGAVERSSARSGPTRGAGSSDASE